MARVSALLPLVAGLLVLALAPSAFASHTTAVHAASGTLGPGGSVSVSGTIECTAGYIWGVSSTVRQKSGKTFNAGGGGVNGICSTNGPEPFTINPFFGSGPFKSGKAVAETFGEVCDPTFFDCAFDSEITEIRIRK
jgi:hypothetical protein